MIRRWVLSSVALVIFLAGCGSDVKEIAINHTLLLMDQTTTKLKALKEKVNSATDKMVAAPDKERELDLTEPIKLCDELKKYCKDQVQKHALEIQSMRLAVTDAEREELRKKFDSTINTKVKGMNAETQGLDEAMKKLESEYSTKTFKNDSTKTKAKELIDELKKKIGEAQAEFESLNRKS